MNLKTKIKLVIDIQATNEEIIILEKIFNKKIDKLVEEECYYDIICDLTTKIEEYINENNEDLCLKIAFIISKIKRKPMLYDVDSYDHTDVNKEEFSDEEEEKIIEENPFYITKEERKLQREAVKKFKNLPLEEIQSDFYSFILNEFPKILHGYDRSIFKSAKESYWNKQNIYNKWEVAFKVSEKLTLAEHRVEEMLKKAIQEHYNMMYEDWLKQYIEWSIGLKLKKNTKQSIKEFFKEIGVKPTETIVQRIKDSV